VEDKIALSDRFGLWLSFYPVTQEHFLSVVEHWIGVLAQSRFAVATRSGAGYFGRALGDRARQPQWPLRLSVRALLGGFEIVGANQ
jgi:predicted AAA+ superfamily ATPase